MRVDLGVYWHHFLIEIHLLRQLLSSLLQFFLVLPTKARAIGPEIGKGTK